MFLDIAFGIFTAILFSHFYNLEITNILLPAILFSLLPDADYIIYKILGIHPDRGYKHRELFHYPLFYLPIGYLAVYFFFGQVIALIFLIASVFHFLHDSIACGRGIQWLFPFSRHGYAFIYLYSRVEKRGLWKKIFKFDQAYTEWFDREHGDEEWLRHIYYRLHPIAIIEFGSFIVAIILLVFVYFL